MPPFHVFEVPGSGFWKVNNSNHQRNIQIAGTSSDESPMEYIQGEDYRYMVLIWYELSSQSSN